MGFLLIEVEYLHRTAIGCGVGTAGRIGKLLGEKGGGASVRLTSLFYAKRSKPGAISLKALTHVIVDASHRDAKMRTIFDIPETRCVRKGFSPLSVSVHKPGRSSLFRDVLGNQALKEGVDAGKVTIVLF